MSSKSVVKNEAGDALDASSGQGVISYDNSADALTIDLSSKVDEFSFYLAASTSSGRTTYFPFSFKMFSSELSQTSLTKLFLFKEGAIEVNVMENLTLSDGV